MKKKVTLLTFFVLLFSSLAMLKAQPPQLTADQWKVLMGAVAQASRAIEEEKKPLGRLLTGEAHRDVRPLIIEYVATAPTFTDAAKETVPLARTSKALMEESIKALANRIAREAEAKQEDINKYATDLLFEVVRSEKPAPVIAIKALKRANADINAKDEFGDTPLIEATYQGHKKIVDALIRANADVEAKGQYDKTPLLAASSKGRKEIVDVLLGVNADVKAEDEFGNTSLILAAFNGHKEIVDTLLGANADVNAQNKDGETPLIGAVTPLIDDPREIDIVQKLLAAGADKKIKNYHGETAYDLATDPEIKKLVQYEE